MEQTMRRADRQLTQQETVRLFEEAEYGVLSLVDEDGLPYGVPMSFALCGHSIYFHGAAAGGKKTACIQRCASAAFTVVGHTRLLPQQFSTLYMSGIARGAVAVVWDEAEKRRGLAAIVQKYAPDNREKGMRYIDAALDKVLVLRLDIETMTGKGHTG